MWYYLDKEDMTSWVKNITDEKLFYKLQSQCLKRIPMLRTSYNKLKKQYGQDRTTT